MRTMTKHALSGLLALTLTVLLVPATAHAQEQAEEAPSQETCTAQLNPTSVAAGESAVRVTAKFSSAIGQIEGVKTGEESYVALADPADIRAKVGMAQEDEQPQPVKMAAQGQNAAIVWLSTADASAGTHAVTLEGAEGQCTGELTISEPGNEESEGGEGGGR